MRPARPRTAWLWFIWSASVDLPESIVPEKKTSSDIGGSFRVGDGRERDALSAAS